MPYYYDLLDKYTGETIYELNTPFDTIEEALIDAKGSLINKEAFWRVFTTPPGRSEHEEPQVTSVISPEFESDEPRLDLKMMLKIHSEIHHEVSTKMRTLTLEEVDSAISRVSNWDTDTEVGAELLAEAFEQVMDRKAHVYKEELPA